MGSSKSRGEGDFSETNVSRAEVLPGGIKRGGASG